jgi:hypothetical protein
MEQKLGRRELNKLIPKSIFLLSFGTKDLFHVWYLQNLRAMDKETSVAYLLSSYGAGIEALFHAGVQKCCPPQKRKGLAGGGRPEKRKEVAGERWVRDRI